MSMRTLTTSLFLIAASAAMAQHVAFEDYSRQRGYYDAPWQRYEAEPGRCSIAGEVLEAPEQYSQKPLQAEASNCIAVSLVGKGDYVAWTCDKPGNGLTIRFSLPDSEEGNGIKGNIGIYVNDTKVADVELDSYWAWQYTHTRAGERYPDNTPATGKFVRMRFDEKYILLPEEIKQGDTFSLRKEDDNDLPYTIDFVELEPVAPALVFADIAADDKVEYSGTGPTLQTFINENAGKTIFIPAGYYELPRKLIINNDNTKIIGAGMWHTILNFTASSDVQQTHSRRGIESSANGIRVEGLSLATVNNKRYYNNNSSFQVGKGFMGSWGKNSVICNVRVDHFECGAWIADYSGNSTDNLRISRCRFRNNYADGVNLCSGVGNTVVTHCSFRNNGDDDMASWSVGNMAHDNEFSYCTAEHNWRASSLAFYGGNNNKAHHILVLDAMECGAHVNGEFQGIGCGDVPSSITDVTIRNAGCTRGVVGTQGDFWGNPQGALHLTGGYYHDIKGLVIKNIDIYGARGDGVVFGGNSGKRILDLEMRNVTVHSAVGYGFNFMNSTVGNGIYSELVSENCARDRNDIPYRFEFVEDAAGVADLEAEAPEIVVNGTNVVIGGNTPATVYNLDGTLEKRSVTGSFFLKAGIYVIEIAGRKGVKIMCK